MKSVFRSTNDLDVMLISRSENTAEEYKGDTGY